MRPGATAAAYRHRRGDQQILEVLLIGGTPDQAAERAGLSRATVYRRIQRPGFAAELHRQQQEVLSRLRRRVVALSAQALDVLWEVFNDAAAPASAKVSAARLVLERADPTPHRLDVAVSPAPMVDDDHSALKRLEDAIERARSRMGLDTVAVSGNGGGGDGD